MKSGSEIIAACIAADVQQGDLIRCNTGVVAIVEVISPYSLRLAQFGTAMPASFNTHVADLHYRVWPTTFTRLSWSRDDFGFNPFTANDGRYSKPIIYPEQQEAQP